MWLLENTVTSCPNWYLELETVAAAFYENVPRRYLHQRQHSLLTVRTKSLILLPFIFIDWEIHRCWTDATFCYDENANLGRQAETGAGIKQRFMYTAPFHTQVTILLLRALTTIWREKVYNFLACSFRFWYYWFLLHFKRSDFDSDALYSSRIRGDSDGPSLLASRRRRSLHI